MTFKSLLDARSRKIHQNRNKALFHDAFSRLANRQRAGSSGPNNYLSDHSCNLSSFPSLSHIKGAPRNVRPATISPDLRTCTTMSPASTVENTTSLPLPFPNEYPGDREVFSGSRQRETEEWSSLNRRLSNFTASQLMRSERLEIRRRKRSLIKLDMYQLLARDLPVDLFFEVLGHLHPIDLYHLSHTTKALRNMVMMRCATSLWRTAFARHPDVPQCPPEISQPQWATILFGPDICDECGNHGAMFDFAFRRHFCRDCMDRCYIHRIAVIEDDGSYYVVDDLVWDLIPWSYRTSGLHYYQNKLSTDEDRRYLETDVKAMAHALAKIREDKSEAGARSLEHFLENSRRQINSILKHAHICNDWANNLTSTLDNDTYNGRLAVQDRIIERITSAGYERGDVNQFLLSEVVFSLKDGRLTRRVWREIKDAVWASVNIVADRERFIRDLYLTFQKGLPPQEWDSLPADDAISEFQPFSALIHASSISRLKISDCEKALTQLPRLISTWREHKQVELAKLVPESPLHNREAEPLTAALDLATSVFWCPACWEDPGVCLIGSQSIKTHIGCPRLFQFSPGQLSFSDVGSFAAESLVELLDLDPSTTSAQDLDNLNPRFICGNCAKSSEVTGGHKILTWRDCVAHAVHMGTTYGHAINSWQLLTSEAASLIRVYECVHPSPSELSWSCSHCSEHFRQFVTRPVAVRHVIATHSIAKPVTGKDVFYFRGVRESQATPRRPYLLRIYHPQEYICKRCPGSDARLFSMRSLTSHLFDKHDVSTPVINEDWTKLDIILRTSTPRMIDYCRLQPQTWE